MYLTPERYRTMGFGIDLDDPDHPIEDIELRSALHRASAAVDSYCNVPLTPVRFDFRGGTVTGETRSWSVDPYNVSPTPYRFWPVYQPVTAVTQFRIYSTPTVYTEVDADEVFVNNIEGWMEVSSLKLTQFGIFGTGLVTTLIGMYHPQAVVNYTYGWSFPITDEYLEPSDASVYRAQNQWWHATPAPVVYVNDVEQTTGFTIDYGEGTVTFDDPLTATDIVTADYSYKLPPAISQATGLIASDFLGESQLAAKEMSGLDMITAGEITLRRSGRPGTSGAQTIVANTIPRAAQTLLSDFIFQTVR